MDLPLDAVQLGNYFGWITSFWRHKYIYTPIGYISILNHVRQSAPKPRFAISSINVIFIACSYLSADWRTITPLWTQAAAGRQLFLPLETRHLPKGIWRPLKKSPE